MHKFELLRGYHSFHRRGDLEYQLVSSVQHHHHLYLFNFHVYILIRTYANSYTAPTQYCSFNLLKVVQVYQNNYCFPSSIEGSAYKSFLTSGSSTLVNSYSAGGCTGTKTSVTVYNTCRRYQTSTSSGLYIAQYWSFLYSNSPPTFKPTSKPSTGKPTQKPITRIPTFAPSTRRPSSALTGYAYFNSYSGSKCTGKVAAITAYPIGICIPQYNTTTIVRYVYYNCDKSKEPILDLFLNKHNMYIIP